MISIVIPTYNHLEDCLKPCIESIKKYTDLAQAEIIIVANGCTDGTREYVQSLGGQFKLLWFDEGIGYTKATNEGIKASKGEYIVLLNNDIELLPQQHNQWIETLKAPFDDYHVGISGPMVCDSRIGGGHKYAIFFCVMIPRKVMDDVGLLDEMFSPGFCEDNDWCARAELLRYRIAQVPDSNYKMSGNNMVGSFPIYHKGNRTFSPLSTTSAVFERNIKLLHKKYPPVKKGKVFDCFLFYNELEILDIRLHELDSVVDEFILVESTITTTGHPKPLYFAENKERFSKFLHKIKCITFTDLPNGDTWARERYARDKIKEYVNGNDNDIVIISDLDEIPNAEVVKRYHPSMGLRCFDQKIYYYWINCLQGEWDWCKIIGYKDWKNMTPCQIRYTHCPKLEGHGGWHLSFMGGVDRIMDKIRAWTHHEYNRPDIVNREWITEAINTPKDVLRRPNIPVKFVPLDDTFPKYVLENKETLFKDWIKQI